MQMRQLRLFVIQKYGGKCACCGEKTVEFLAIDHVNGRAAANHPKHWSGSSFYTWLQSRNFPKEGFRVLCHNCNLAISNYGSCPHQELAEQPAGK